MGFHIKKRSSFWGIGAKSQSTGGANGFTCSMQGYSLMVQEIISLALLAITINMSLIETFLDLLTLKYLAISVKMLYAFLKGFGGWSGYALAALYYFGLEFGYADLMCELSKYGYTAIYYLNFAVTFGQGSSV